MDALAQALRELADAESAYETSEAKDGNAFYLSLSERHYMQAEIYAAVAQAEQLKRIADAMEWRNQLLEKEAKLFDLIAHSDE